MKLDKTNRLYQILSLVVVSLLISCSDNTDLYANQPKKDKWNDNPKTYYVDAAMGDDTNNGTSPEEAWRTLEKINSSKFRPGDKLLLKKGEVFNGTMNFVGEGTKKQPIFIDAYGEAEERPLIKGTGTLYAARIYNSTYVTVQNIAVSNLGEERIPFRSGLQLESDNYGISHNITVNNVYVFDVNSELEKAKGGSGIAIVTACDRKRSRFEDMIIENCHIKNCSRNGIIWGEKDQDRFVRSTRWYPNRNTIVRNNLIEEVPGDGIVPIGCDKTLIEYNIIRDCNNNVNDLVWLGAAAGIWPWSCDNTTIQFNEVGGEVMNVDGQGYDADYNCRNTVIQYNYSHDNNGGLVLLCCDPRNKRFVGNQKPIIRYNISIGDGTRGSKGHKVNNYVSPAIHFIGPVDDALIEHNIIHANAKGEDKIDRTMFKIEKWPNAPYAKNPILRKNIFYATDESDFEMDDSPMTWDTNWYLGTYKNLPQDRSAVRSSKTYQKEVLDIDPTGYKGLQNLMEERTIGGRKHYFVKKEAIEAFFERMKNDSEEN